MKTELRLLLIIVVFTFGFCLNPNAETISVDIDTNCYFVSNDATEMYNVRENNTLTNEISINKKNVVDFYETYEVPVKEEEKENEIEEVETETTEEVETNQQPETNSETVIPVEQPVVQEVQAAAPNMDLATSIVNYAVQFVGNPYVYGGTSLTNGTDCSGFTQSVFANFGISLPRTAPDQGSVGSYVPLSDIQTGDLVLYGYNGSITHVALYIGNGQVVHALNPNQGIAITAYNLEPIMTVRRVL